MTSYVAIPFKAAFSAVTGIFPAGRPVVNNFDDAKFVTPKMLAGITISAQKINALQTRYKDQFPDLSKTDASALAATQVLANRSSDNYKVRIVSNGHFHTIQIVPSVKGATYDVTNPIWLVRKVK